VCFNVHPLVNKSDFKHIYRVNASIYTNNSLDLQYSDHFSTCHLKVLEKQIHLVNQAHPFSYYGKIIDGFFLTIGRVFRGEFLEAYF
jgi:hypothetical protein